MRNKIIWALLLLLCGCNPEEKEYETFDAFPGETFLNHQLIRIPPVLFKPMNILLLKDALVVIDFKSDYFFHVFSYPGFTYSGSFVHRGHGPEEETFIHPSLQQTGENQFACQTINFIHRVEYDPASERLAITESLEVPGNLFELQQLFPLGDRYVAWNSSDDFSTELMAYNPSGDKSSSFGAPPPDYGRELSVAQQKMISDKIFSVRSDQTRFAALYYYFPILRIYAADGSLLKETRFNNHQLFPEAAITENRTPLQNNQLMNNYQNIMSTDKHIYGLYSGKTHEERSENNHSDFSNEIHVWDWEGNPIRKILLDQEIYSFDVTTDDRILVGSSLHHMDQLFRYELPGDLEISRLAD